MVKRVCSTFMMASKQLSIDFLGSPEPEAYVNSAGGTVDNRKKKYFKLLSSVY